MTLRKLLSLLRNDVDDISRVAFSLPKAANGAALLASARLLESRSEAPADFEERLVLLKTLRFIQAAIAGRSGRLDDDLSAALEAAVRRVRLRTSAITEIARAADDVLEAITARSPEVEIAQPRRKPGRPKTTLAGVMDATVIVGVKKRPKSPMSSLPDFRGKTVGDLRARERELRAELSRLQLARAMGRGENASTLRMLRRDIARIQKIINLQSASKRA